MAWFELIKLGKIGSLRKDINTFFRGNIIRTLKQEGWFEFLEESRSLEDMINKFNYSDENFLLEILETLISDNTIKKHKNNKYQLRLPLNEEWIRPKIFTEGIVEIFKNYAESIPMRLNGKFFEFSGGFSLYNWDDALGSKMYRQIRKSAFAFSKVKNKKGVFLDVGCGNGYGTAAIWYDYYKAGHIKNNAISIKGIDYDEDLLKIASEEFELMVNRNSNGKTKDLTKYRNKYPEFLKGDAANIPFEDETFDFVYCSQVLHWTKAKKAVKEMLRVTKPGGIVFGTENLFPGANKYNNLHFLVIEGAQGFFSKDELVSWAKEGGAKKISILAPVYIFKFIKNGY